MHDDDDDDDDDIKQTKKQEILQLTAEKKIVPWTQERPLNDANQAVIDLGNNKARYCYVLAHERNAQKLKGRDGGKWKKTYASERLSQRGGLFNASNFGLAKRGLLVSRRCPRVYLCGVIAVVTATLEHSLHASHKLPKSSFRPCFCLLISSHLLSSLQPLTLVKSAPVWHSSRLCEVLLPKLFAFGESQLCSPLASDKFQKTAS